MSYNLSKEPGHSERENQKSKCKFKFLFFLSKIKHIEGFIPKLNLKYIDSSTIPAIR
jgi:hypothetical protein